MPPIPDEVLPKGVACPHCASIGTGQPLRLLDSHNTEEARSYLDSPGAAATLTLAVAVAVALALTLALALALALALTLTPTLTAAGTKADLIGRSSSGDQPAQSPLKVGDDFQS